MNTICKLGTTLCFVAAACYAESYTGTLMDANCAASPQAKTTSCEATATTTSYAVRTSDGKMLKLDSAGNSKVASEIKAENVIVKDAQVTVTGTVDGQTLKVDSISFGHSPATSARP